MLVNKFLKPWKWMVFANVFIGCSLFNMYVKGDNKKIWHEMITFVCDSKSYARMNKYIIVFKKIRFAFGYVSILIWFLGMFFHKAQMYATHIVVVMEACIEYICTWKSNQVVKASTLMNKPLIMNKIHYIC
jgi:hypothetical protein